MEKIELDFGAITIDNSTFKSEGYKFYEGLLAQMQQFKESPIQVLQTDIVHKEAVNHIKQEITKTRSSIEQALRSANKQLKIKSDVIENARELLSVDGGEAEIAEARLEKFYESIGAEKIDSGEYVDFSRLMKMYFSTEAPFETGKDKKNEFPDAIALLALEGWADQNDINIVAVSQDKGWQNYSQDSNRVTLVSSLAEALEKFQAQNKVANIITYVRESFLVDDENNVLEEIEQAVIDSIDGYDIRIEANSYMYFEWDDTSASYISYKLDHNHDGLVKLRVVGMNDDEIVLKIGATIDVEVEASFDFSVRDSIDKDYIGMGGNTCTTIESYHTDILLTLIGDFSQDPEDVELSKIEVLETIVHANFGEIEPDWRSEHEDEEL